MLIRNGIKQNLRAKRRTIPFFILITILTIVMIFSVGINSFCDYSIKNANESYRSIIEIEYMGEKYPSKYVSDSYSREAYSKIDFDRIKSIDGVKHITYLKKDSVYLDGYSRKSNDLLYQDYAVLVIYHVSPMYNKAIYECDKNTVGAKYDRYRDCYYIEKEHLVGYTGIIANNIYSYSGKEQVLINIQPTEEIDFDYTKQYLVHGYFTNNGTISNGFSTLVIEDFDDKTPGLVELNNKNQYLLEDSIFTKYAEKYSDCNNFCFLNSANDIEDLVEFHEAELALISGRFPEDGEEDTCVLTNDIFKQLGISLGDTITLNMLSQDENNIFDLGKTNETISLRVVGVISDNYNYTGEIYKLGNEKPENLYGYLLSIISVENSKAAEIVEQIKELMPNNVRLTLLDQGYLVFVGAFNSVSIITKVISYITSLGVIMVIIIFAFFFVVKQKENIKTLILFGTSKKDIRTFILSGALTISITGTILGGIIGILCLPLILKVILNITSTLNNTTLLYSETTLGLTKEITEIISVPILEALITVALIIILIIVFLCIFLSATYKDALPKKGITSQKYAFGNLKIKAKGPLKFALLSIKRNRTKSLIVPIVSLILTIMIIFLSSIYQGYSNSINEASKDIKIEGQVTSISGTQYSNIALKLNDYLKLSQIEFIDNIHISQRLHYFKMEEMPHFSSSSFGQEHMNAWIDAQPEIVFVTDLLGAKEFYYVSPNVTFLEGYSESIFLEDYPTIYETSFRFKDSIIYPILVNETYLKNKNIQLGDIININISTLDIFANCKIVGYYSGLGDTYNIYAPFSMNTPLKFLDSAYECPPSIFSRNNHFTTIESLTYTQYLVTTFSTCRFTIKDGYKLDKARNMLLDLDYTSPNKIHGNRTTIIFRDSKLVELKNTLGRYVILGKVILIVILLIVSLIAFVISWLNIHGRNKEFLYLRGLGVSKKDVFMSFLIEQAILLLIGFLIGLISLLFISSFGMILVLSLIGFILFYLLGASIEIKMLNNINLMELLSRGDE